MLRMAEDNRAFAESPAPRNLQGRMGLYLCICRLQPGPDAKSGDSNDISLGRVCSAPCQKETLWPITMLLNFFFSHKIAITGENLSRTVPFSAA
jgi:hypothetical protein